MQQKYNIIRQRKVKSYEKDAPAVAGGLRIRPAFSARAKDFRYLCPR